MRRRPDAAPGEALEFRQNQGPGEVFVPGILLSECACHQVHLRLRLFGRDARLQTADGIEHARSALVEGCGVFGERGPQVDRAAVFRKLHAGRSHSDHGEQQAVDVDGAAEDPLVACEAVLPQGVTEHGNVGSRHLLFSEEAAPEFRLHAEHREQVPGGDHARDLDRRLRIGESEALVAIRDEVLEDPVLLAEVEEVGIGELRGVRAAPTIHGTERHDTVGVGKRQRAQDDRIDDRKDGGGGADSERQRERGRGGEAFRSPEPAKGVPKILRENVDAGQGAPLADVLFDLRHAAELAPRREGSFGRVHSAGDETLLEQLQVGADFFVEFVFEAAAPERVADSREQRAQHHVPWRLSSCNTRPMTPEMSFPVASFARELFTPCPGD